MEASWGLGQSGQLGRRPPAPADNAGSRSDKPAPGSGRFLSQREISLRSFPQPRPSPTLPPPGRLCPGHDSCCRRPTCGGCPRTGSGSDHGRVSSLRPRPPNPFPGRLSLGSGTRSPISGGRWRLQNMPASRDLLPGTRLPFPWQRPQDHPAPGPVCPEGLSLGGRGSREHPSRPARAGGQPGGSWETVPSQAEARNGRVGCEGQAAPPPPHTHKG